MAFIDRVREHLQQVARAPDGLPVPAAFAVDETSLRRDLLAALERLEARDRSEAGRRAVVEQHRSWTSADHLITFAVALARRLRRDFASDATDGEIRELIRVALARRIGLDDSAGTLARTMELDRLASSAAAETEAMAWADIEQYAEQLQAVRVHGGRAHLTAIARVLLDLQGREAIRWLLYVEAEQSVGPRDPFRLSREAAAHLAAHPQVSWNAYFSEDVGVYLEESYLVSPGSIERLGALGLLEYSTLGDLEGSPPLGYTLYAVGQELLDEVGGRVDTPMRLLAHALVQDETQRALTAAQPAFVAAMRTSTAENIARQARMVAHELSNALVPVQVALDGLYELVAPAGASDEVARYRRRIDAGLARAFRFVDQSLAPAALLAGGDEPFDVGACLRDAIAEVNGEARGAVRLVPLPSLPPALGSRARFVLALLNLLRNAVQATRDRAALIEIAAEVDGGQMVVRIDDNGPGVPPEHRQAIFVPGFKLRLDGSGLGLSLVKEVVEVELSGSVSCEQSPLGGARFVIRLPIGRRRQP